MEITLNTTPTTTDDLTAFSAEYEEWNKLVEQNMEWEQPENKEDWEGFWKRVMKV